MSCVESTSTTIYRYQPVIMQTGLQISSTTIVFLRCVCALYASRTPYISRTMYAAVAAVIAAVVVCVDTAFIVATVVITTMTPYFRTTSTCPGYVYTVITSITIIIHITSIIHTIMSITLVAFIIIIMIYTFRCFLTGRIKTRPAVTLVGFLRG